jgi:2-polyprenyl-3-methyl-5-hydroxy-6-metoxy-1,4-benzoquinol methylase
VAFIKEITMNSYDETFETWNRVALQYQDKFMDLDLYNHTYAFFCNLITTENAKLLEIGCGPGNITKYLLSRRPDFAIFGIDIAPKMIELAIKNNPTASFAIMDSRQISNLKLTYDGIICGFCIPYLSHADTEKLITDCYNLLIENGQLYLSFVEGDPDKSDFQVGSTGDKAYFYYYNLVDLTENLKKINFELIKIFKVCYKKTANKYETHTILIAERKTIT